MGQEGWSWSRKCHGISRMCKADVTQSAMLALISGAALAGSTHIGVFLAFRFIAGASAFMILAAVPIWMSEVVPPHLRGALVNVHAISLVLGYCIQAWIGFGFFHWGGGGNLTWRIPIVFQCVWPLMLLCGLYWVPESRKHNTQETHSSLLTL